MRITRFLVLGWVLFGLSGGPAGAQQLRGAAEALKLFTAPDEPAKVFAQSPTAVFRRDLESYRERSGTLSPRQAAEGWLALANRYLKLPMDAQAAMQPREEALQFQHVAAALPAPRAWDELARLIQERLPAGPPKSLTDGYWRYLSHLLKGDTPQLWDDVTALRALLANAPGPVKPVHTHFVQEMTDAVVSQSSDPNRVLQALEFGLSAKNEWRGTAAFPVPDLVTLVGPQRAEAFLRRTLTTRARAISIETGDATRKLARRIALEEMPRLKVAQWGLVNSLDAVPLFEAMSRRFPESKAKPEPEAGGFGRHHYGQGEDPRATARLCYTFGLVAAKRAAEAAAKVPAQRGMLDGYQSTVWFEALKEGGYGPELLEFLRIVLTRSPDLSLWSQYVSLSAQLGKLPEAIAVLRARAEQKTLTLNTQMLVRTELAGALLAADQVEAGAAELRRVLAMKVPNPAESHSLFGSAMRLARIGHVLGNADWLAEGLRVAGELAGLGYGSYNRTAFAELLQELGRTAQAERVLVEGLAQTVAQRRNQQFGGGDETPKLMVELAGLYHRAARHVDVLLLLDESPAWPVGDLRDVMLLVDARDTTLGQMAAAAHAAAGRNAQAVRILEELLRGRGDYDPAYELLVRLQGEKVLPFLDSLASRDRFEERPLIWRAQVLLTSGRLEEAEQAARAAISIDPSDGEQKYGRRMRVYAILGEIRAARGDAEQAKVFAGAVRAIRTAERADALWEAGLLDRALKLYKESLTHFADAYCIQSRLAVQLANQGRMQEAEVHYRRAYELMPDSFGRLESHCFGCEGVFQGKRAAAIAEQVFTQLAAKTPEKPQVHYLLGYLREQQDRPVDALRHYREAVRRDPDYLNAWSHIQGLGKRMRLPLQDRDAVALALLRLDPLQQHVSTELDEVSDLRQVWTAAEVALRHRAPVATAPLYPLAASAQTLKKEDELRPELREQRRQQLRMLAWNVASFHRSPYGEEQPKTAGETLVQHSLLKPVLQSFEQIRSESVMGQE